MVKEDQTSRVSIRRFQQAQDSEKEYWREMRESILSNEYKSMKQNGALKILGKLRTATDNGRLDSILEIGGGADPMIEYFDGEIGVVIDPLASFFKAEIAPSHLKKVEYYEAIGENLPFRNESFDGVILYNCIDHGLDPFQILREGNRVLRTGGALHILLDTYSSNYSMYQSVVERIKSSNINAKHPHCLQFGNVQDFLRALDFIEVVPQHDPKGYSMNFRKSKQSINNFFRGIFRGHRRLRSYYRKRDSSTQS
jgi:ubiquinone/menaquinone biosynthesis C-methylase UbiE